MRLHDVRIERTRNDQSSIGITALIEDGRHTLVQFGLRRWPDDGSSHELAWTAVDRFRDVQLKPRGFGLGGGVHPDRGAALDGGIWLEGPVPDHLLIQCHHNDELLIESDSTGRHLDPIPSPIGRLDILEASKPQRLRILEELESAGWRQGKAIADEIIAITDPRPTPGPFGIVAFAIERWGHLLRIAVNINESDDVDYPPRWWSVGIDGHRYNALGEHFQSGRAANLIGHLLMIDPAPERPLSQF